MSCSLARRCVHVRPRSSRLLTVHSPLAGDFDAAQALDAMLAISGEGRMLMVGHEPDLSRVVGELTGGRVDVKKGGLAIVRLDGAAGELVVLMRPRELAVIAGVPLGRE
jgi:phosphohistidine phosphatase